MAEGRWQRDDNCRRIAAYQQLKTTKSAYYSEGHSTYFILEEGVVNIQYLVGKKFMKIIEHLSLYSQLLTLDSYTDVTPE